MKTILVKRQAGLHQRLFKIEVGCKVYDNCFTCPYPDCIKGTPEYQSILGFRRGKFKNRSNPSKGLEV